jgi:hypothetical protein
MTQPGNIRTGVAMVAVLCLLPAALAFASGHPVVGGLCVMLFAAFGFDLLWLRRRPRHK